MNQYPGNVTDRLRVSAGAALAVATLAMTGCGADSKIEIASGDQTAQDQTYIDSLTTGDLAQSEVISDADLRAYDASTTNCGGKIRKEAHPEVFFEDWIGYANQFPELAPQQMELFDTLLGREATDVMLTRGYLNPDTSLDVRMDGDNYRENELAHRMTRIQINQDLTLANTTCIDKNGNVNVRRADGKPLITLLAGQYTQAVVVDNIGTAEFLSKAKKMSDGGVAFQLLPLGTVTVMENGVPVPKNMTAIVLKADACANITPRAIPTTPVAKPPKTHVPGTPQPTTPPHIETTIPGVSSKNDPRTRPAGNTAVPRDSDRSAGDIIGGGIGPAGAPNSPDGGGRGQILPVAPPLATIPNATPTTNNRPPASTAPQPTDTQPPAPVTAPATSTPETRELPTAP